MYNKAKSKNREYHTDWFFVDSADLSKTVYTMITSYLQNSRYSKNNELWAKYCAVLYLTGARRSEPMLGKISITRLSFQSDDQQMTAYVVKKVNAKHFKRWEAVGKRSTGRVIYKGIGDRLMLNALFPPASSPYEKALWDFVAPNKINVLDFSRLLPHPDNPETYSEISKQISLRFKADITDGNKVLHNAPITPHMLRHARVHDMRIAKKMPKWMVRMLFGWNKEDMADYYDDVRQTVSIEEMKKEYSNMFKTNAEEILRFVQEA